MDSSNREQKQTHQDNLRRAQYKVRDLQNKLNHAEDELQKIQKQEEEAPHSDPNEPRRLRPRVRGAPMLGATSQPGHSSLRNNPEDAAESHHSSGVMANDKLNSMKRKHPLDTHNSTHSRDVKGSPVGDPPRRAPARNRNEIAAAAYPPRHPNINDQFPPVGRMDSQHPPNPFSEAYPRGYRANIPGEPNSRTYLPQQAGLYLDFQHPTDYGTGMFGGSNPMNYLRQQAGYSSNQNQNDPFLGNNKHGPQAAGYNSFPQNDSHPANSSTQPTWYPGSQHPTWPAFEAESFDNYYPTNSSAQHPGMYSGYTNAPQSFHYGQQSVQRTSQLMPGQQNPPPPWSRSAATQPELPSYNNPSAASTRRTGMSEQPLQDAGLERGNTGREHREGSQLQQDEGGLGHNLRDLNYNDDGTGGDQREIAADDGAIERVSGAGAEVEENHEEGESAEEAEADQEIEGQGEGEEQYVDEEESEEE